MPQPTTTNQIAPPGISPLNGFAQVAAQQAPYFNPNYAMQITTPATTSFTPQLTREQQQQSVDKAVSLGKMIDPTGTIGAVAKVGQSFKVAKVTDLLKAKNLLTPATEKPGSVLYHMNKLANDVYEPIKTRVAEGKLIIEDGRHRLEAAKQLGIKDLLVEDVTKLYGQGRDTLGRYTFK